MGKQEEEEKEEEEAEAAPWYSGALLQSQPLQDRRQRRPWEPRDH